MRPLLASLAIVLLGLGAIGCGSSTHRPTDPTSSDTASSGDLPETMTTTADGTTYDRDDRPIRFFGHEADVADRLAITSVVTHFYALAAKEDGTKACPLIQSLIAETIVEEDGEQPGLRGKTCSVVMSKVFKQRHQELTLDSATLKTISVRVQNGRALVLLRFAKRPVPSSIQLHREGTSWKIWELFAPHMP